MKKFISIILAVLMIATCLPLAVFAEETVSMKDMVSTMAVGDTIEFGSYPQTDVTEEMGLVLTGIAPSISEWTSYNYYEESVQSDYMKYYDLSYNGNRYRGVYFSKYRPYYWDNSSSSYNTYQDDNGYTTSKIYWFRYESLTWRILDPKTGYVICENIIDSQAFNNECYSYGKDAYGNSVDYSDKTYKHYANNWEYSTIRKWLNETFYTTAFSSSERGQIPCTKHTTPAYDKSSSAYDVGETGDYVFLPTYQDMLNTSYGFSSSNSTYDINRRAHSSDYAKSQGVYVYKSSSYQTAKGEDTSYYRLRSAANHSGLTPGVNRDGYVSFLWPTSATYDGIRPALCFNSAFIANPCSHNNIINVNTVSPTCTTTGYTGDMVCSDCGETVEKGSVIEKSAHSYTSVVTAPTCTNEGYTTYTCSACGDTYTADKTAATGHIGGTANCTDKAVCSVCGVAYGEVNASNHKNIVTDKSEKATCIKPGLTEGSHCAACGVVIVAQKYVEKSNHSYSQTAKVDATCTKIGSVTYTCSVCGDGYTNTIPATDHNYKLSSEKKVTCTTDSTKTYKCSSCGDTYTQLVQKADGHKPVTVPAVAPTCSTHGYTEWAYCSVCNKTIIEKKSINKLSHTDVNSDGVCDECGVNIEADKIANCSCNCHKSGFMGFIYKIQRFFWKLFSPKKQICACGVYHW